MRIVTERKFCNNMFSMNDPRFELSWGGAKALYEFLLENRPEELALGKLHCKKQYVELASRFFEELPSVTFDAYGSEAARTPKNCDEPRRFKEMAKILKKRGAPVVAYSFHGLILEEEHSTGANYEYR